MRFTLFTLLSLSALAIALPEEAAPAATDATVATDNTAATDATNAGDQYYPYPVVEPIVVGGGFYGGYGYGGPRYYGGRGYGGHYGGRGYGGHGRRY